MRNQLKTTTRERLLWCKGYRRWSLDARRQLAKEIRGRRFLGIQRG